MITREMDSLMWKEHRISLGLEKNHKQNVIYELQNEKHEDLTTHNEIICEMCYFYENLYDTKNLSDIDIINYLYLVLLKLFNYSFRQLW